MKLWSGNPVARFAPMAGVWWNWPLTGRHWRWVRLVLRLREGCCRMAPLSAFRTMIPHRRLWILTLKCVIPGSCWHCHCGALVWLMWSVATIKTPLHAIGRPLERSATIISIPLITAPTSKSVNAGYACSLIRETPAITPASVSRKFRRNGLIRRWCWTPIICRPAWIAAVCLR